MKPKITEITYTYKKPNTEVWVLNTKDIPIKPSLIKDQQIIRLGPLCVGGNHTHPRIEWFIAFGELEFIWLNDKGAFQREKMNPDGKILLFEIPPFLPHAVSNVSPTHDGILIEFANAKMDQVTHVSLQ